MDVEDTPPADTAAADTDAADTAAVDTIVVDTIVVDTIVVGMVDVGGAVRTVAVPGPGDKAGRLQGRANMAEDFLENQHYMY